MQTILHGLLGALGVYGLIIGLMYVGQRSLMYHPGKLAGTPQQADLAQAREIRVETADGLSLLSWFVPPEQGRPIVLYFHGNAGTIAGRAFKASILADNGIGVLLAEYRAYGGNPGTPTEAGLYADARANLAWLAGQGIMPSNVVIYGESLGTGVAVQLALELAQAGTPARALILEAPFTSMADAGGYHYPWAPTSLLIRDRFESKAKIADVRSPVMVIHGTADRTVPQAQGRRLYELAKEPKRAAWLEGAGHTDVYDFGAGEAVIGFIDRLMAKDG